MKSIIKHHLLSIDRFGLACLGLLLLSPVVFKVLLPGDIVAHPFTALLCIAWGWVAWTMWRASGHMSGRAVRVPQNVWIAPFLLLSLLVITLTCSSILNGIWFGSVRLAGWLLLVKWLLYLAPLPLTALLVIRTGRAAVTLVSYLVPVVAMISLGYSLARLIQARSGIYANSLSDSTPTFFAMGMLGEVFSSDGLVVRADTVSQGAYGMYLVFVLACSLSLCLFNGWAPLPRWYRLAQAMVVCPAAGIGILYTGSRTSLMLLIGVLLSVLILLFIDSGMFSKGRRFIATAGVMAMCVGLMAVDRSGWINFPTLDRMEKTLESSWDIRTTARGEVSPLMDDDRKAVVRNVQTRVWLWGKTIRYLQDQPTVLLTGIGYDRKRYLEEVVGLPYEGRFVHLQTAHNIYLDVLIKGGLCSLAVLLASILWLFKAALQAVRSSKEDSNFIARIGIGWALLSFWPAFVLMNLFGEEMFTDNLLLHWSMLFGLLLGLNAIPSPPDQGRREPGGIVHDPGLDSTPDPTQPNAASAQGLP